MEYIVGVKASNGAVKAIRVSTESRETQEALYKVPMEDIVCVTCVGDLVSKDFWKEF